MTVTPRPDAPFADAARFASLLVESNDLDPLYAVLGHLERPLPPESAWWLTFLYLAFYDVSSALRVHDRLPLPSSLPLDLAGLPAATERRSLRMPHRMVEHVDGYLAAVRARGSQQAWWWAGLHGARVSRETAWSAVERRLAELRWNGRWAAFKGADVAAHVHGMPLEAPNMGHKHSTGPREGLSLFYEPPARRLSEPEQVCILDAQSNDFLARLRAHGAAITMDQGETVLCKFKGLQRGHYYVGHDHDELLGKLHRPGVPENVRERVLAARAATAPPAYLGERGGWTGIDRERVGLYARTREVVAR